MENDFIRESGAWLGGISVNLWGSGAWLGGISVNLWGSAHLCPHFC